MSYDFPDDMEELNRLRLSAEMRLDAIQEEYAQFRLQDRDNQSSEPETFEKAFEEVTDYLTALYRCINLKKFEKMKRSSLESC